MEIARLKESKARIKRSLKIAAGLHDTDVELWIDLVAYEPAPSRTCLCLSGNDIAVPAGRVIRNDV